MALTVTQTDLGRLKADLTTGARADAVKALVAAEDYDPIAMLYNTVDPTLRVPRGVIDRSTFVRDCERLGVWTKLIALSQSDPTTYAGWAFYLQHILPLLDSFDVSGETFARHGAALIAAGLLDDAGLLALTTRLGTPAEALVGHAVTAEDVQVAVEKG